MFRIVNVCVQIYQYSKRRYMMYTYYQPNKKDLKDNHGDCVIRALTMIMDKSWLGVFDDLIPYARELQDDFSCRPVYEKYLIDNGFTYIYRYQ